MKKSLIVLVSVTAAAGLAACSSTATRSAGGTTTSTAATKSKSKTKSTDKNVSTSAGAGSTLESLAAGGRTYKYVLHKPAGLGSGKAPLVINLHGSGGSGEKEEELTGMDTVADSGKFIVAYPDAYTLQDVKALIGKLKADGQVDPDRIYITGISKGGVYTEGLGCELAGEIAGIAPVAGPMADQLEPNCKPSRPLPVLLVHGTADPIVPYAGGTVDGQAAKSVGLTLGSAKVDGAVATMNFWRQIDGCSGATTETPLASGNASNGTSTTIISGATCKDGTKVSLYRVNGGGHTWPGGSAAEKTAAAEAIVGKTTDGFNASQVIWDFFKSLPA